MILYSIFVLVLFSPDYAESAPFYEQNAESKFPLPEDAHMNHEKMNLELQPTSSNPPEVEKKKGTEPNSVETKTQTTEDGSVQLAKKLMKDVSDVREKINEGDHSEETDIGNIDLEAAKSDWKNPHQEKSFPTNGSSVVETVIPLPPIENKDISSVQRSPQKLDITAAVIPPLTLSSASPSSEAFPENKHDDLQQPSHEIVPMKEVISLETTVIPTLSSATPLIQGTEGVMITHATTAPSTTMSASSNLEASTTDTIPTFSSLKKTEFSFGSSEELESAEEELSLASTTAPSEITQQSAQRMDILTTKISEILLPTEPSTTFSTDSEELKESEPSVSQESKPEQNPLSSTLFPPTLPAILVPTVQPASSPKTKDFPERSFWIKVFDGIRCSMKDCARALHPDYHKTKEIKEFTVTRFARDHGPARVADTPCSCETKKAETVKESKTTSASKNVKDMKTKHF
ncbi:hypothetical protein FO519_001355 [Halicephalobus sp. NKZ332]|nr:hypothetical protein FO519_001355 [Halicephalobus sp. NKZ332]